MICTLRAAALAVVALGLLGACSAPAASTGPVVALAANRAVTATAPLIGEPTASGPIEILFAQDSVGWGRNATFKHLSFRPLVTAALQKSGVVTATAFGEPGFTVSNTAAEVAISPSLDIAVIELGTNDARVQTEPAEFVLQYSALLDRFTHEAPDAAVLCLSTLALFANATEFDALIQPVCEAHGGTYVSIADITANPTYLQPQGTPIWNDEPAADSIHPNDAGHAAIAERILAALGR